MTTTERAYDATCGHCKQPIARLSPASIQWVDARNNIAYEHPYWHSHSPDQPPPASDYERAQRQLERLYLTGRLTWLQYREVKEAVAADRPPASEDADRAASVASDREEPATVNPEQLERIEAAFWAAVVAEFPGRRGDLDPGATISWETAAREAVDGWLFNSCPPCAGCGAEVYSDGTHVLDSAARTKEGYPSCPAGTATTSVVWSGHRCNDCRAPVVWDEAAGDFRHADATAPPCFLIRE